MKKLKLFALVLMLAIASLNAQNAPLVIAGCNNDTIPGWGNDLGVVSFATAQEWTISGNGITQIWSDAVTATGCQKTLFDGSPASNALSDCRCNPEFKGDLFSFCAVSRFRYILCPAPWRVPTRQDFIDLDIALGGTGNSSSNLVHVTRYIDIWGGEFNGSTGNQDEFGNGILSGPYRGGYWAVDNPGTLNREAQLFFSSQALGGLANNVDPRAYIFRQVGLTLRCIRAPEEPTFGGATTINVGSLSNNIPNLPSTYTFSNAGVNTLEITSLGGASPRITISTAFPIEVESLETGTISFTIDTDGLPTGAWSGYFVLLTNDPVRPEVTITVNATIVETFISRFIDEDFTATPLNAVNYPGWSFAAVAGVSGAFTREAARGIGGSPCIQGNITGTAVATHTRAFTTSYVQMGSNPIISFWYAVDGFNVANQPIGDPSTFEYWVEVTTDFGATWQTVLTVLAGESEVDGTNAFVNQTIALPALADEIAMVRFTARVIQGSHPGIGTIAQGATPNLRFLVDNVNVGTKPQNELEAISLVGSTLPTVGIPVTHTMVVRNNGAITQTAATYSVRLMQFVDGGADIELATLPGVEIAFRETVSFEFTWTPTVDGATAIYAEVVLADDEFEENNTTNMLSINVLSASIVAIEIGDGTTTTTSNLAPIATGFRKSFTQTLYFPNEIGANGGEITALVYRTNSTLAAPDNFRDVRVWIGETDQEMFTSSVDSWIPLDGLTRVVDRATVQIHTGQNMEFVIPFDIPFNYQGGNLVVAMYKFDEAYRSGPVFRTTAIANSGRILQFRVDAPAGEEIDVEQALPTPSGVIHAHPNITMVMNMSGMGALSGIISNVDGFPMEGVRVQIVGSALYTTTNTDGEYRFPFLVVGSTEIEVSIYGYNSQVISVTIVADETTTQNITLNSWETFVVSGTVIGNNAPNGLEHVVLTIHGEKQGETLSFTTTTNATGDFTFENVWSTEYTITARLRGFQNYSAVIEVDDDDVIHNITLYEIPFPVSNVVAEVVDNNAVIAWDAPQGLTEFRYDAGVATGQVGFQPGATLNTVFGAVHMENATLHNISWFLTGGGGETPIMDPATLNVFVFPVDANGVPLRAPIYRSENVTSSIYEWNTYEFEVPVDAPNGFYIAISRAAFASIGVAEATAEWPVAIGRNIANSDFTTADWLILSDVPDFANTNLMIRAEGIALGAPAGSPMSFGPSMDVVTLKNVVGTAKTADHTQTRLMFIPIENQIITEKTFARVLKNTPTPEPIGYKVYRLQESDDVADWTLLTTTPITTLTFTDTDFSTLGQGVWQYAVRAVYTDDVLSPAQFSNILPIGMEFEFTVNVSVNYAGGLAEGAMVTLTNQNENRVFTQAVPTSGTVVFPAVWKGTYNLSVSLERFYHYTAIDIVIQEDGSRNVMLVEIIKDPFNLEIDVQGANATLTWNNTPFEGWFEDFENGIDAWTISRTNAAETTWNLLPDFGRNGTVGIEHRWTGGRQTSWLISPAITLPTQESLNLSFWSRWMWSIDNDYTGVWISTTDNNPESFTELQRIEPIVVSGNGVWSAWREDVISLNAFRGQTIYVAFKYEAQNGDLWLIDDVSIELDNPAEAPSRVAGIPSTFDVFLNDMDTPFATGITETEFRFEDLADGTHTAGVQAVYSSGISTMETIDFVITNVATSIEVTHRELFVVFPNPTSDYLNIQTEQTITKIELIDLTGRMVQMWFGDSRAIDVSGVPAGIYILHIHTENAIVPIRIVKQ